MKKSVWPDFVNHSTGARKSLFKRVKGGRLAALFVLALLAAAVVVSTAAWAQTKKAKKAKHEVTLQAKTQVQRADTSGLRERKSPGRTSGTTGSSSAGDDDLFVERKPKEERLMRAHEFKGDLRDLPQTPPVKMERPEREDPDIIPRIYGPATNLRSPVTRSSTPPRMAPAVAAPTPLSTFEGLDFNTWGGGHPPDTNGDVGPTYYIETVNTSIGIYNKGTGVLATAFTFNTFMSQGNFGNLCDTNNFGDPVVVYDTFEDRWIITDFAFQLDGLSNVINPPGNFQCFAASKTSDPVAGGWNFYSINTTGGLGDYPKFGIWPDGLYMSVNMFNYSAGGAFQNSRLYAFNKAQMYAGAPAVQSVSFNAPSAEFTLLPANARLQTGTPPLGSPNYFSVVGQFLNVVSVYKFHVDWNSISLSSLTGPFLSLTATSWSQFTGASGRVPTPVNNIDTLYPRLMVQNQYTNIGGVESLWDSHTVGASGATSAQAAIRYYQVKVTGGSVEANATQAFTYSPDLVHRFMPSVAVDSAGNMAIGYDAASATLNPAIRYAGRLATDPVNTITLTEQSLIEGTGTQSGSCGGTCFRWGDYSAMSLDPDGCTFWYTNEYYIATGLNDNTRVGSFRFAPCTTILSGTLQGTVTATAGGAPISGATVAFGSRTAITNGSGFYSFAAIPSGTYPSETASDPGFNSSTTNNIVVSDAAITTKDFSLTTAPASACLTDTTQADFQTGVPSNVDLIASPGDAALLNAANVDQQNLSVTPNGFGFNSTAWAGQTFTPAVTGQLTRADLDLFCSSCTGTFPNLTVSIRATTGATPVPTGADLATATIPGFNSGAGGYFSANFGSPATLTAGTTYALVIRAVSNPSLGTYAYVCSCAGGPSVDSNPYTSGQRVTSANSGGTWAADVTVGGRDLGFVAYMQSGFASSGDQVSTLKDANPGNHPANWSTLSWTASVPVNTSLKFQVGGSNSPFGPFNFVGPDTTAATFFTTSGASLSQFYGLRYLKYKAYLATSDGTVTPKVNDVTVCFAVPTAAGAAISGQITTAEGLQLAGVTVNLSGAKVATAITDSSGSYKFESVDTGNFYTVTPSLANYSFSPGNRSFSLLANKADATFTASVDALTSANAIDTNEYFVRQQYLDFLGREPDQVGLDYWTGKLNLCNGDAGCVRTGRVETSAAFFQSQEFNETGSYVYRLYRGTLGRQLSYNEFAADRQQVIGGANLDASKTTFATAFVSRAEFAQKYQANLTAASFVEGVLQTLRDSAGVDLGSQRANLISRYNAGGTMNESRAVVVRDLAENAAFSAAVYNPSFVLMEYFGYLRRGSDQVGYAFWLNVLNNSEPQNYRGMVCSFITSAEYQHRFGTVVTRSNADCAK